MRALVGSYTAIAAAGIAVAALTAAPPPPAPLPQALPTVSHRIELAAVTVPPGGLVTSFLGNQLLYCSLICTSAAQGVATVTGAVLQTPATFATALQSGDLVKAIGVTAASVTGPATAAAADVIFKDGMVVAPRALNAFETGVVGLLNVVPAARDGLPGVLTALETAREHTFTALNLPLVPNPAPTVEPHGVLQVAVIGAIDVVAAVIFPALNEVLLGVFQVSDAAAQTLARTGDPLQAVAAAAETAATVADNARDVIAAAVVTAVTNVGAAGRPSPLDSSPAARKRQAITARESSTATISERLSTKPSRRGATTTEPTSTVHKGPGTSHEKTTAARHAERGDPQKADRRHRSGSEQSRGSYR
jgi:hypothetical protein